MLLIKYLNVTTDHQTAPFEFTTEDKLQDDAPCSSYMGRGKQASNAIKVIASDKWLDRIRKHFKNLPDFETGVYPTIVAWYGDYAKFIAGNLADVSSAYWDLWMESEDKAHV